jgi:micrococcal nuclease
MRPRAVAAVAVSVVLLALAAAAAVAPRGTAAPVPVSAPRGDETVTVLRVVDGDTIQVRLRGRAEKIRLIGVDTPESVDPRRPVEYFGKEAAAFTRRMVEAKVVILRGERGKENRDRYGRLLRYVYLPDGTCLNAEIIRQGYGHAYVRFPFRRQKEFRAYEREAREAGRGLWAPGQVPSASPVRPLRAIRP